MVFNRKERLQIAKKINQKGAKRATNKNVNWRLINFEKRKQREKLIFEELEEKKKVVQHGDGNMSEHRTTDQAPLTPTGTGNQRTWYSLCVALPGSILNNIQTYELKTYVTGELARTFATFCVDEVIVFDDTAKVTEAQVEAYYSGDWTGEEFISEKNNECNFFMARIFEFLECPQYLRKPLFPFQRPLQFSAILNPLNSMHHLRANELHLPFREGIVLDKRTKKGHPLCDVGLERELICETSDPVPPNTRITVRIQSDQRQQSSNKLKGSLASAQIVRAESGIYWGYSVRIAKSISDVLSCPYDFVIGTSEKGNPISGMPVPNKTNRICKILILFGGLGGLECAIESDESVPNKDPAVYFPNYVNCLPDQGSRVIRTEEAIPICLTALKCKLDWPFPLNC